MNHYIAEITRHSLATKKAFFGLTRKFSALKPTGYLYSMRTSYMPKAQRNLDFSVHDSFKCWASNLTGCRISRGQFACAM